MQYLYNNHCSLKNIIYYTSMLKRCTTKRTFTGYTYFILNKSSQISFYEYIKKVPLYSLSVVVLCTYINIMTSNHLLLLKRFLWYIRLYYYYIKLINPNNVYYALQASSREIKIKIPIIRSKRSRTYTHLYSFFVHNNICIKIKHFINI